MRDLIVLSPSGITQYPSISLPRKRIVIVKVGDLGATIGETLSETPLKQPYIENKEMIEAHHASGLAEDGFAIAFCSGKYQSGPPMIPLESFTQVQY